MSNKDYVNRLENVIKQMLTPRFYFSPSDDFKIIYDTHHFILSYEMILDEREIKIFIGAGIIKFYLWIHYPLMLNTAEKILRFIVKLRKKNSITYVNIG